MFEKKLKELSRKIGEEQLETYFILTHKKHQRDIYFQNSKRAIHFIKPRFNSFKKKIIYSLLKIRLLQLFLKKIYLSSKFGEVIYAGNQVKGFDLEKKIVTSFPIYNGAEKIFLKSKRFQKKISFKGFAPKIFELNSKIPYSKEKILKQGGADYIRIFKRLLEFYNFIGIERIPIKEYASELKKKIKDRDLIEKLNIISRKKFMVLITTLHGDPAQENILIDDGRIMFIDWSPHKGPLTDDLVCLFKKRFSNDIFNSILEFYPKEIKNNLNSYLILSRVSLEINKD